MEQALRDRCFKLREVAAVAFLNDHISHYEWQMEIDASLSSLVIDGQRADNLRYNDTLRTLTWYNPFMEGGEVASGALTFDHNFARCHGKVTTGEELSYLVEGVSPDDGLASIQQYVANDNLVLVQPKGMESSGIVPIATALNEIADEPANIEPPPTYLSAVTSDMKSSVSEGLMCAEKFDAIVVDQSASGSALNKVDMISYATQRRDIDSTDDSDWEPFDALNFGTDNTGMMHTIVYFGSYDIGQYVVPDGDANRFTKQANKVGDSWVWGFDITFSGELQNKGFSGVVVSPKGKEYQWKGSYSSIVSISREGSKEKVKGSDGLSLDQLLYGVSSISREEQVDEKTGMKKAIDLAQVEADKVFGRLIMGSVDQEISKMLFPGKFVLTEAEKEIQKLGQEFLKRAGVHTVLANIKASEHVKAKTRDRINDQRCQQFIPMCIATQKPDDIKNDPVFLYGLDRVKDKATIEILQKEAQNISRACYLFGYRTVVASIQPYLNNAGEWYSDLQRTLTRSIFITDFQLKATGSEGFAKRLFDIHTKLDVLWQVTQEKTEFKDKLPADVQNPEELIATLNAAGLAATLDNVEWDDTSRAHLKEFWSKLDEVEKDARTAALTKNYRRQMIADEQKHISFQTMGEYVIQCMEELRQHKKWSGREAEAQLALLDAQQAQLAADAPKPAWHKDIKWKEGFMAYFRSAVTVVALGGMVYLLSQKGAHMEWEDQLAMFGQIAEGLLAIRTTMTAVGGVGGSAAMKLGNWLNKWVLAPLGKLCVVVGKWLYRQLGKIGKALIEGISKLLAGIKKAVSSATEFAVTKVGQAGTWLKNLPIQWGGVFNALAKFASFGISAICFWISVRDCTAAWKDGRPIDIVTSTIAAALAGLEVLVLVVSGIATMFGGTAVVSFCATAGMVLAVAGIVFAVVLIIFSFVFEEDPLDDLVVKYGKMYGIVS